ncbi:MAG: GNAT family N-acetyltransferase [Methylomonas sp.]|nr:GNAT family N-acetyltransferase [Methylomonas sp.]
MGDLSVLLQTRNWRGVGDYLDALPVESWDAAAYFAKGLLLAFGPVSSKNLNDAADCLETACQLDPVNRRYRNTLSELYLQLKRPALALHTATIARMHAPHDPLSGIALGKAAWFCGEHNLALRAFNEVCGQISEDKAEIIADLKVLTLPLEPFWQQACQGNRLTLVRTAARHREFLLACRRNRDFQRQYHRFQAGTPEAIEQELNEAKRPPLETRKITWVVERQGQPLGLAALVDLDIVNSRAEILIGFPDKLGFGIGLEATLLVMEFAFSKLGLSKLVSYVYGDNPLSQANTQHLGFRREGLLDSHVADPTSGERIDLYINGCLSTDFFSNARLMALAKRLLGRTLQPAPLRASKSVTSPEMLMVKIAQALTQGQEAMS